MLDVFQNVLWCLNLKEPRTLIMSDTVPFTIISESTNHSINNTAQEVNDLCDFLKLEFQKYCQHKILHDIIQDEIVRKSACDDLLRAKVKNKLMKKSFLQCSDIGNIGQGNLLLLGVDESDEELSFTETIQFKNLINNKLQIKYREICDDFNAITGSNINEVLANTRDTPLFELSLEDKILLDLKQQLTSVQNMYIDNLLEQLKLLEEMANLRINTVPHITQQKIQESEIKSKINVLRSKIAQEKVRVDIFTETEKSLDAFKILISDIKQQKEDTKKEIEELEMIKEKYKSLSCKQFDDIFKSFLQYKSSIEKKRLLYDYINS